MIETMVCTVERIIMTESNLVEWGQLLVSIFTLVIACMALSTWKKELIGKKKINLAMDIIEKVCTVEDLMHTIRNPGTTAAEHDSIIRDIKKEYDKDKHPKIHKKKLYYLVPAYRIIKNWDKIQDFISLKNKARLYWDDDIMELFEKVLGLISKVKSASKMLYNNDLKQDLVINLEEKIWENYASDDLIKNEMHHIVEEFIVNLEPLYIRQKSKWVKKGVKERRKNGNRF